MIKIIRYLFISFILVSCAEDQKPESGFSPELNTISEWFSAWELVSDEIYELENYESVDFVFFDSEHVYSTSSTTIAEGTEVNGPKLFGETLGWKVKKHNGEITLPSGEIVPLGLMVFASPLENKEKESFFIMPLPSFWEEAGVKSDMPYHLFLTGIFLHEFSHTQQMNGIGAKITELSKDVSFNEDLNDEYVQQIFSEDSNYVSMFEMEHSTIFELVNNPGGELNPETIRGLLNSMEERQKKFFVGDYAALAEINPLFLTMEGVGQYTMYEWLIHPKGGNIDPSIAFDGTRTKSWIQDEGFGLALLLSKISHSKKWSNQVFGKNSETITELLRKEVKDNI